MDLENVLSGNADGFLDEQAEQHQQERTPPAGDGDRQAEQRDGNGKAIGEPTGEEGKPEAKPDDAAKDAPPASQDEPHVPRKALEDERRKRQQLEQELTHLRQSQQAAPPQDGQQQQVPPEIILQRQIINERLNMSEMMLRQQHDDVDVVIQRFEQEVQKNPALQAEVFRQTHPWKWAYDYAKRLSLMDEIGSDPDAYKTRVREQLLSELQQQQSQQPEHASPAAEKPNLPKSLAGARSAGARSAPAWTGPTPLDSIIK
ncbi:hypothetical protein N5K27_22465 [Pigmentiphaga sp. GD03639]|uniref:hypothetical protein n=1 Tax=Pigmentiphaga sp. GD03639 TaxID=2975354 RepID=UPI0024498AB5|nr:hypothetical protein [Pigmentiphaga sp. GD03639]MDH2239076.1 hypothetical protein [Pigmentiphaga sp. GD03639]